jgi:hypothetical protein
MPSFDALLGDPDSAPQAEATPAVPELDDRPAEQWTEQPASPEQPQQPYSGEQPQQAAHDQAASQHPLANAPAPEQETPGFEPSQHQDVTHPDQSPLSGENPQAGEPTSDQQGLFGAPPTTGSIEVPRREAPDLQPAGGAHHFRGAHLAVIGAIAFMLGVVVWNLAGPGL